MTFYVESSETIERIRLQKKNSILKNTILYQIINENALKLY